MKYCVITLAITCLAGCATLPYQAKTPLKRAVNQTVEHNAYRRGGVSQFEVQNFSVGELHPSAER